MPCLYCGSDIPQQSSFCPVCGLSTILALPYYPVVIKSKLYISLNILGILAGVCAILFTLYQEAHLLSIPLLIFSLYAGGITLEAIKDKFGISSLRFLAIISLASGIIAYLLLILLNSRVPGIGYSM